MRSLDDFDIRLSIAEGLIIIFACAFLFALLLSIFCLCVLHRAGRFSDNPNYQRRASLRRRYQAVAARDDSTLPRQTPTTPILTRLAHSSRPRGSDAHLGMSSWSVGRHLAVPASTIRGGGLVPLAEDEEGGDPHRRGSNESAVFYTAVQGRTPADGLTAASYAGLLAGYYEQLQYAIATQLWAAAGGGANYRHQQQTTADGFLGNTSGVPQVVVNTASTTPSSVVRATQTRPRSKDKGHERRKRRKKREESMANNNNVIPRSLVVDSHV